MFGLVTNLPVALAYVVVPLGLPVPTNYLQAWHGTQCLLHLYSCWLPRLRIHLVSIGPHSCLYRGLHILGAFSAWDEAVACEAGAVILEDCSKRGHWLVPCMGVCTSHKLQSPTVCYTCGPRGMSLANNTRRSGSASSVEGF